MRFIDSTVTRRGSSRQLAVLIHGYRKSASSLQEVRELAERALPDADILMPSYPANALSNQTLAGVAAALNDLIENAWHAGGGSYENVILIGHSMGALIARKAFCFGWGKGQDHPSVIPTEHGVVRISLERKTWAAHVSRIVLLAGMNRGWSVGEKPSEMSWFNYVLSRTCARVAWAFGLAGMARDMSRGSPFVANLRVQWMELARERGASFPLVVQLLGDKDDVVSNADNMDVQTSHGFIFRPVSATGHPDIVRLSNDPTGTREREIRLALIASPEQIPTQVSVRLIERLEVKDVVFVVHGIRDFGHWTAQVKQALINRRAASPRTIEVITSGYGFFPMLPFLFRFARQRYVRWFMDQYTEARAAYPKARISFIGHSNGTYLLASAMETYRACDFHRAVLAGSVVRMLFPWDQLVNEGRIERVRNLVATADLVVGVFPGLIERFGFDDIGSAGQNGFRTNEGRRYEVCFVDGGHGAGIVSVLHPSLASFILDTQFIGPPSTVVRDKQSSVATLAWRLNWLLWILLVVIAAGVIHGLGVGIAILTGRPVWPMDLIAAAVVIAVLCTI